MRKMKRALAMLLVLAMTLSFLPTYAFAADTVLDAAIFCSDVHGSTSDLTSVMSGVKTSGVTYSSIGFVGDTCLTVAKTESAVNSGLGYTPKVMFSYASSHDTENSADISTNWNYSGEVENVSDYYLVYTIREDDMKTYSNAQTASAAFTTWYNNLTDAQKQLPIFVMSHRPIHARRGGNQGGEVWTQAFNAAGKTSDIVVFWAHNHTGETDTDIGYYYAAKGSTVNVANSSGSTSTADEAGKGTDYTINFTYMNAGYINANNQNPGRINVATTVQITANSLIFQDYTTSGTYSGTYAHNVTVAREFAAEEATLTSITVSGTTEYTVGDTFVAPTVKAVYSDDSTVDITSECTFSGYDMSTAGTQTVTVTWGEETTTYEITVKAAAEVNYINVSEATSAYTVGDELYAKVYVYYTDGTSGYVTLDECEVTPSCACGKTTVADLMNTVASGTNNVYHQVTITYGGASTTHSFTVDEAVAHTDEDTGIIVSVSDAVSASGTIAAHTGSVSVSGISQYVAYDITPGDGYALKNGNYATITFLVPDGYSNPRVYCVDTDEWFEDIDSNPSTITVRTNHFSTWVVADNEGETGASVQKIEYIYKLVDEPEMGKEYLIVSSNAAGAAYALRNNMFGSSSNGNTYTDVTILSDDVYGTYIILPGANRELWLTESYTFEDETYMSLYSSYVGTYTIVSGAYGRFNYTGEDCRGKGWTYDTETNLLWTKRTSNYNGSHWMMLSGGSDWYTTFESSATPVYFYEKTPVVNAENKYTIYIQTETLVADTDHMIVSSNVAGPAWFVHATPATSTTSLASTQHQVYVGSVPYVLYQSDEYLWHYVSETTYVYNVETGYYWKYGTAMAASGTACYYENYIFKGNGSLTINSETGALGNGSNGTAVYLYVPKTGSLSLSASDVVIPSGGSVTADMLKAAVVLTDDDGSTVTLDTTSGTWSYYTVDSEGSATTFIPGTTTLTADASLRVKYTWTEGESTYSVWDTVSVTIPTGATASGSGTTGGKEETTVYVLTSSLTNGGEYLIVNVNAAGSGYAMGHSSGSVASDAVTVKNDGTNTYIEASDVDSTSVWTATTKSSGFELMNGSYYLEAYGSTSALYIHTEREYSTRYWVYSNNKLYYDGGSGDHFIQYSSNTFSSTKSSATIYIYQKQTISTDTTTTVTGTYSIEGTDVSMVVASDGSTTATLESTLIFTDEDGNVTYPEMSTGSDGNITYEIVSVDANGNTVNGDPNGIISSLTKKTGKITFSGNYGTALVKVSYETEFGTVTDYITVTATAPYYTIELHYADLTEVASDATFDSTATYYVFNSTTKVYEKVTITAFESGVTYYTTPVVQGDEIDDVIALKGIEAGDRYPIWAVVNEVTSTGATDLGELGDALTWTVSDTSIATIDTTTGVLTFTGNNYGTFTVTVAYEGADGKVITDTITISATESLYVVPGDGTDDFPEYPNEGSIRFDKTATAVGNFSETGIAKVEISMTGVPYTTGNELDVVLVLDMTGSMDDVSDSSSKPTGYTRIDATIAASKAFIKSIVINEDGTYNDNRIGIYVFNKNGASTLYDLATINTDAKLEALIGKIADGGTEFDANYTEGKLDTIWTDYGVSGGTPYDDGLGKAYDVLAAAKTDGTGNNRQQFCVFMTDGVPTDYEYITGTTHANYSSASDIAGMLTSASDYATRDTDYKYEYYSTEMKKAGVTVYSVGVGLFNENNAWSGSATQCGNLASALLNDISGPANEASQPDAVGTATLSKKDSYFFSVDDADAGTEMTKIFSNIAQKIVEAAKDIVVEDKIGNNYSINFSLPGEVTSNETGGLSEFYIQVVEYQLDSNKERTGDPYVKENITFTTSASGVLSVKSHTVDGTSCGDSCTHVTITNNQVTAIDGTYFDYKRVAETENGKTIDAEYLTWNEEKISTTELCLQYFAHLDNSSDAVGTNSEIPAGTYYTNEYATLTYTNFQGNEVQNEFPVPQMTWNGAQVSYVFYLVNEAGQPVNRAGRVVPFAEAVYVTDVYTKEVVWNSLEQAAGLEADYLAESLVPEAYALYDDDAEYFIHVYEDEKKDNLNNHFVIGGDVTDDYNTTTHSWTNANTTYVFNTKADAKKYNIVGTYINSDGTSTAVTSYLCKGDGTVTATIEQVTVADATAFAAGTYFVLNSSGNYVQAAAYDANATYYAITSASYTAASGETQWKPTLDSENEEKNDSVSGGTVINGYIYYIDENNKVYTIVQKSNGTEVETGFDFHNTTVAFAVVWKPELAPDTVVIDYGLDVVIDVIKNDNMAAGVVGVRTDAPSGVTMNSGNYTAAKATSVDVSIDSMKIGTATVENLNSVRFSLDKTNGMQFTDPAVFYYEADVNYYNSDNELQTTSMYSSVTVIPATTVYYEDSYVTFSDNWEVDGTTLGKTQDQDRPGASKIAEALDADNNYGYDAAYSSCAEYSMGSAHKVHVDASSYGTATFSFYGTGFDVISMASSDTGSIAVKVTDADGNKVAAKFVDTYYGYAYGLHKATYTYTCVHEATEATDTTEATAAKYAWVKTSAKAVEEEGTVGTPSENPAVGDTYVTYETGWYVSKTDNAMYQIPVLKISNLDYGKYDVTITATYMAAFDDTEADGYDLYLDAIRIYNPTGNLNDTANKAYVADGEGWPSYEELRNLIITANDFDALTEGDQTEGAIFMDHVAGTYSITDYTSYGPNNEMYLAVGQAVSFSLAKIEGVAKVQLALKSVGGTASVKVYAVGEDAVIDKDIETATDMYYDITDLQGKTVVIMNDGDSGILSITNIKTTYSSDPSEVATTAMFMVSRASVNAAIATLSVEEEVETTEPEEDSSGDEDASDDTVVEDDTATGGDASDDTVVEDDTATGEDATEPEEDTSGDEDASDEEVTEPEEEEPTEEDSLVDTIVDTITNIVNTVVNALKSFFSKWFR